MIVEIVTRVLKLGIVTWPCLFIEWQSQWPFNGIWVWSWGDGSGWKTVLSVELDVGPVVDFGHECKVFRAPRGWTRVVLDIRL